jgi:hypothetical protein
MPEPIEVGAVCPGERVQREAFPRLVDDVIEECAERSARKLDAGIGNRCTIISVSSWAATAAPV